MQNPKKVFSQSNVDALKKSTLQLPEEKFKSLSYYVRDEPRVKEMWSAMLRISDIFVALFFLMIGFATILHIQYDTYGIKKTIFPLMVGIVLAHFSLFIVQNFVDFAQILSAGFYKAVSGGSGSARGVAENLVSAIYAGGLGNIATVAGEAGAAGGLLGLITGFIGGSVGPLAGGIFLGLLLLAIVIVIIPALLIAVLSFLLYIRGFLIIFLAIISPLAWLAIWWSPVQGFFKKWWGQFTMWVFMAPVSMFFIWMSVSFSHLIGGYNFMTYVLSLLMLYLAVTMPLKMGGAVMGAWAGFGKKASAVGLGGLNKWTGTMMDRVGGIQYRGKTVGDIFGIQSFQSFGRGFAQIGEQKNAYSKTLADERAGNILNKGWTTSLVEGAITFPGIKQIGAAVGEKAEKIPRVGRFLNPYTRLAAEDARARETKNRRTMENARKRQGTMSSSSLVIDGINRARNPEEALEFFATGLMDKTLAKDHNEMEMAFINKAYKGKTEDEKIEKYFADKDTLSVVDQAKKQTDPYAMRNAEERQKITGGINGRQLAGLVEPAQASLFKDATYATTMITYLQKIAKSIDTNKTYHVAGQEVKGTDYQKINQGEIARMQSVIDKPTDLTTSRLRAIVAEEHASLAPGDLGGHSDLVMQIDPNTAKIIQGEHGNGATQRVLEELVSHSSELKHLEKIFTNLPRLWGMKTP